MRAEGGDRAVSLRGGMGGEIHESTNKILDMAPKMNTAYSACLSGAGKDEGKRPSIEGAFVATSGFPHLHPQAPKVSLEPNKPASCTPPPPPRAGLLSGALYEVRALVCSWMQGASQSPREPTRGNRGTEAETNLSRLTQLASGRSKGSWLLPIPFSQEREKVK